MIRLLHAVPLLAALTIATAACAGGGDDGSSGVFPLQPTDVAAAASCNSVRSVQAPRPGTPLAAGTITEITEEGTFGLSPAFQPLRVTLSGAGEYRIVMWVTNGGFGAISVTYSDGGTLDGTATRQWTLQAPVSIQLVPTPSTALIVDVCAP